MRNPRTLTRSYPGRKPTPWFASLIVALGVSTACATVSADLREREAKARADVARLTEHSRRSHRELEDLRAREQKIRGQLAEKVATRNRLSSDADRQLAALGRDLRATYPLLRDDPTRLLFGRLPPGDAERAQRYLSYMTRARLEQINEARASLARLGVAEAALGSALADLVALAGQAQAKEDDIRRQKREIEETLGRIARQKSLESEAVGHRQARERIRELVRQAKAQRHGRPVESAKPKTTPRRPPAAREVAAVAAKPEEAASPGRERPESGPLSFGEPVDFGSLKGTLRWPVRGKLRRSVRDAPLRFRKAGIWLVGASNAPVRAVAAGRVAFADEFRGLGQLIILDHGDGFLSLYAETAELLKREGDFVETGEAIGSLGAASAGTPRLYFEIRHKGTAQDPLKWCAPHRG